MKKQLNGFNYNVKNTKEEKRVLVPINENIIVEFAINFSNINEERSISKTSTAVKGGKFKPTYSQMSMLVDIALQEFGDLIEQNPENRNSVGAMIFTSCYNPEYGKDYTSHMANFVEETLKESLKEANVIS